MRSAAVGGAVIYVDQTIPATTLDGVPGGWANRPVVLAARATDATSGMGGGAFTAIRVDGGAPTTAPGNEVSATVIGDGVHTVAYYARDAAGNANNGGSTNGIANEGPATAAVRIDRGLTVGGVRQFPEPARPGDDRGAGHRPAVRPGPLAGGCGGAARRQRASASSRSRWRRRAGGAPRPLGLRCLPGGRVRVPCDRLRRGGQRTRHHATRKRVGDGAEQPAEAADRAVGRVRRVPRRSGGVAPSAARDGTAGCSPAATSGAARTSASSPTVAAPSTAGGSAPGWGRRWRESSCGSPSASTPVRARRDRTTTARTGHNGVFTARLAPGPSRQVEAVFAGDRTASRSSAGTARLRVRGGVRLKASSGDGADRRAGGDLHRPGRRGRVGDPARRQVDPTPVPGAGNRPLDRVPNDPDRRAWPFPLPLCASATTTAAAFAFQFRAFAPAQSGWPFDPAGSNQVTVTGR